MTDTNRLASRALDNKNAQTTRSRASIWAAADASDRHSPTSTSVINETRSFWSSPISQVLCDRLAAILMSPLAADETYEQGACRKERELLAVIPGMSAVESLRIEKQLTCGDPFHPLVCAFARINIERRARFIAALQRHRVMSSRAR